MKQTGSKSCPHSHEYSKHKQNPYENQAHCVLISHQSIWEEMGKERNSTEIPNPPIHLTLSNLKESYLKFICPVPAEGLQGKTQVICFCQGTQIKIILGINTGGNINIEL